VRRRSSQIVKNHTKRIKNAGAGYLIRYSDGLRSGRPVFDSHQGQQDLLFFHSAQTGSGVHPAAYPTGTRGCPPGVERQGREVDHSPPFSAEVKNGGAISTLPHTP
jgi:hypothetical protein